MYLNILVLYNLITNYFIYSNIILKLVVMLCNIIITLSNSYFKLYKVVSLLVNLVPLMYVKYYIALFRLNIKLIVLQRRSDWNFNNVYYLKYLYRYILIE